MKAGRAVASAAAGAFVVAAAAACASPASGLTSTCTVDDRGILTVTFTNHTRNDIEISSYSVYYGQSASDVTPRNLAGGAGGLTVPAGRSYASGTFAVNPPPNSGATCQVADVTTGPTPPDVFGPVPGH
jgi:hypothetical protein